MSRVPSMPRRRPSPSMAVALLALFVALGGTTYATTTGPTLELGRDNTASGPSTLTAPVAGQALEVRNTSTRDGATALDLTVAAGHPPLTVSSDAKVVDLNADSLDGLDAAAFLRRDGKAADADRLDGRDADDFLGAGAKASDADLLDGQDSADFLGVGSQAADSDLLDGLDSSSFLDTDDQAADSSLLDGLDSSAFLRSDGKAADADRLDGVSSRSFVRGRGALRFGARAIAPKRPGIQTVLRISAPALRIAYWCPSDVGRRGALVLVNTGQRRLVLFVDDGRGRIRYRRLRAGARWAIAAPTSAARFTLHARARSAATADVFTVHRPALDDCLAIAHAALAR